MCYAAGQPFILIKNITKKMLGFIATSDPRASSLAVTPDPTIIFII
jgi:hypothetical protein